MKNIISIAVISLLALSSCKRNAETPASLPKVEQKQVEQESEIIQSNPSNATPNPSASFMKGYWDGWHGTWLGPIKWTINDDYRQGHMLGSYDRKNKIKRYSPEQR